MLTFAKLANELIYVTKLTNEDLVNILLACVYEPLDLKDKNGNPYYAGKGECSYLLKGKRDVKLEIQRGTSKKEVIDHAEAYFERFIVSKILPSLLNDFLENMRMIITYDSSSVPSMALILLVKVQSRVFTAKCSEPQVGTSNGMDEGSGVTKFLSLRTET